MVGGQSCPKYDFDGQLCPGVQPPAMRAIMPVGRCAQGSLTPWCENNYWRAVVQGLSPPTQIAVVPVGRCARGSLTPRQEDSRAGGQLCPGPTLLAHHQAPGWVLMVRSASWHKYTPLHDSTLLLLYLHLLVLIFTPLQ